MVAPMSVITQRNRQTTSASPSVVRSEFVLAIALGTAAIFFSAGSRLVEIIGHPLGLIGVFLWLFAVILWAAICVARHADCLAIRLGEPYGTLILTLSAISIEVVMISTAMLHGANNPELGRDAIFAVMMVGLNGFVGICRLLVGVCFRCE